MFGINSLNVNSTFLTLLHQLLRFHLAVFLGDLEIAGVLGIAV
jgi:hypothetical protein